MCSLRFKASSLKMCPQGHVPMETWSIYGLWGQKLGPSPPRPWWLISITPWEPRPDARRYLGGCFPLEKQD